MFRRCIQYCELVYNLLILLMTDGQNHSLNYLLLSRDSLSRWDRRRVPGTAYRYMYNICRPRPRIGSRDRPARSARLGRGLQILWRVTHPLVGEGLRRTSCCKHGSWWYQKHYIRWYYILSSQSWTFVDWVGIKWGPTGSNNKVYNRSM